MKILFSAMPKADLFSTSLSHHTIKKCIIILYIDLPRSIQYALHFIFLQINREKEKERKTNEII